MNENDFVIGEFYHYSELPDEDTEEISVTEYGKDYIGMNAIHIRFYETETDVWLIWHHQRNEAIFKCVYKE